MAMKKTLTKPGTPKAKAAAATAPTPEAAAKVVGKVEMRALASVSKNPWNPNVMTAEESASLQNGFEHDGWLASQALLIWGKDDKGITRNLIIDGEHRHETGVRLGIKEGPMVVLDGLKESYVKSLTIKMNAKRGKADPDRLGALIRDIQYDLDVPDLALDLGIQQDDLMKMLAVEPESLDALTDGASGTAPIHTSPGGPNPVVAGGHVAFIQLFYSKEQHAEFIAIAKEVAAHAKTKNVSDTVMHAMKAWKDLQLNEKGAA